MIEFLAFVGAVVTVIGRSIPTLALIVIAYNLAMISDRLKRIAAALAQRRGK